MTTTPSSHPCPKAAAATATTTPTAKPLITPTASSFTTTPMADRPGGSPNAMRRTVTASAWVPAFPPIPAITGIHTANATRRLIVSWKKYTTAAANEAVNKLRYNHGSRLRTASCQRPPNSSCPETPPNFSKSSVLSASTTSITSSKVTRPRSFPLASTTGTAGTL